MDGNYSGFAFDRTNGTVLPVQAVATGSTVAISFLNTINPVTLGSNQQSIVFTTMNAPNPGVIEGSITEGTATTSIVCMGIESIPGTTRKAMFCVSQAPKNASKPYNLALVSKP